MDGKIHRKIDLPNRPVARHMVTDIKATSARKLKNPAAL